MRDQQMRQVSMSVIERQLSRRISPGPALPMLSQQTQAQRRSTVRPRIVQKPISAMTTAMMMVVHNGSAGPAPTPQYWLLPSQLAGASLDAPQCSCPRSVAVTTRYRELLLRT